MFKHLPRQLKKSAKHILKNKDHDPNTCKECTEMTEYFQKQLTIAAKYETNRAKG